MKTYYLLAASAAAVLLLAGCATDMAGTSAAPATAPAMSTATSTAEADKAIDVYYDGFYGTVTHGYWSVDGSFYYQDASGAYQKDYGYHFVHGPQVGSTKVHLTHG